MKRSVTEKEVRTALEHPHKIYYDLKEGNFVAIREVMEGNKKKLLIVIFLGDSRRYKGDKYDKKLKVENSGK